MTDLMTCQSKDLLIAYLYDEASGDEQRLVETHLAECAECRAEAEGLTSARGALTAWEAPRLTSHFRVVDDAAARTPLWRRTWVAAPLAAAAAVVLVAGAAAIANLEIRYDQTNGLLVRTGWSAPAAVPATPAATAAGVQPVSSQQAPAAPWRTDLAALEHNLRAELASAHPVTDSPAAASASVARSDDQLLRRVQQLIDESEVRQQRNLALRMTEVSRDFTLQRQQDLVQIQNGFGRLEGRTEVEAARARELMNYIMRVSQQEPPR